MLTGRLKRIPRERHLPLIMSTTEHTLVAAKGEQPKPTEPKQAHHKRWYAFLLSPLWGCLLLALLVRVWLVIHTHGVIDGDEALVGIQAQHILHGEFPLYFYGQ